MTLTPTPWPMVNPARAGMIRSSTVAKASAIRKPRASGDDPTRVRARLSVEL